VRAVGYATKAKQHGSHAGRPKMVLIGDIVGADENEAAKAAASEVVRICQYARWRRLCCGELPSHVKSFGWIARARRRLQSTPTRSRLNEDVVIPLPRMGDYCDGIERINIELSISNKLKLCAALGIVICRVDDATESLRRIRCDRRRAACGKSCAKPALELVRERSCALAELCSTTLDAVFPMTCKIASKCACRGSLSSKPGWKTIFDGVALQTASRWPVSKPIHKDVLRSSRLGRAAHACR
jgi:FAD/FMN-containing dehydrogenase